MRTVLTGVVGRAALIFAVTGMVGGAAGWTASASAATRPHGHAAHRSAVSRQAVIPVEIGTAVAYVREPNGTIRQIR